MQVTLNGKPAEVRDGATVRAMLDELGLTEGPVAVEINREIVPRAQHVAHQVKDGDVIEVVHLVGGG